MIDRKDRANENTEDDYDDPYEWKDSFVRSWLNGAFINKAFSADELAIIDDTKLEEEACVDKVFLL